MWRFEAQQNRYGGYLYIRDEEGYYWCYFKNCGQKMHSNFAKHIEIHEEKGDEFDDDYRKLVLNKYRGRAEATMSNVLRLKSTLARAKQDEIPLSTCLVILETLCAYCDSVPLPVTELHDFSVRPSRGGYGATLCNLVFEPLLAKAYTYVSQVDNHLDLGAVYRNLSQHAYKDAEQFAMDVRHALNFARLASTSSTPLAPLGVTDFQAHLRVLSTSFAYLMEYERLKLRFKNAEAKIMSKYSQLELPYAALIEIIRELLQNTLAVLFLDPIDVALDHCPFLIQPLPTFYDIPVPYMLTDAYDDLKRGKFAAQPAILFARTIRAFFLRIMLWNEPNSDLYINASRLAQVFEGLLEKAYQNALRATQSEFRYSTRDDQSRLLIWDPQQRSYYLEYFETPSEWGNAKAQREEFEANEKIFVAEHSIPAPGEELTDRPITRFAKAPVPMLQPTHYASYTANTASANPAYRAPITLTPITSPGMGSSADPNRQAPQTFSGPHRTNIVLPSVGSSRPSAMPGSVYTYGATPTASILQISSPQSNGTMRFSTATPTQQPAQVARSSSNA